MIRIALLPWTMWLLLLAAPAASGQEPAPPATVAAPPAAAGDSDMADAAAGDDARKADAEPTAGGNALTRLFVDVGRDYRAWFTLDSTRTLMVGTAAALSTRPFDESLTERGFPEAGEALNAGDEYGNLILQVPFALGWWGIGNAVGPRHGAAGRDLVRAQISAASWTYAIKYAVGRTRPNGDPRSFPSGHSSAAFAAATVFHRHYGWKLALPFYGLGVYTAAARINDRKHWLSDTVMGATVGVTAGRAVTVHIRERPVHVVPVKVAGGAMIQFVVDP